MTLTSFYNNLDLYSLVGVEGLDKKGPAERIGVGINVELVEEVIVTCKSYIHIEKCAYLYIYLFDWKIIKHHRFACNNDAELYLLCMHMISNR